LVVENQRRSSQSERWKRHEAGRTVTSPRDRPNDQPDESARLLDWMRDAACLENRDVDFIPVHGAPTSAARAVSARCLVDEACLAYALTQRIDIGIWGGKSAGERRRLRRRDQELS